MNKTCRLKALRVGRRRPTQQMAILFEISKECLGKTGFKGNPIVSEKRTMGFKTLNHSMLNLLCVVKFDLPLNFNDFNFNFIFTATNL